MKSNLIKIILFSLIGVSFVGAMVYGVYKRDQNLKSNSENNTSEETETDDKLDKTQLAIQINSEPKFSDGTSNGNLLIANSDSNIYNIIVEIYLQSDNSLVYQSEKLKPGEKIDSDKLLIDLDKGKYKAIAYFKAYDDDGVFWGKSGAVITLNIEK